MLIASSDLRHRPKERTDFASARIEHDLGLVSVEMVNNGAAQDLLNRSFGLGARHLAGQSHSR